MKKLLFIVILVALLCGFKLISDSNGSNINEPAKQRETTDVIQTRLNKRVAGIKNLVTQNPKYNTNVAFFVDMRIPSGKNRFFVYDLNKNEVIDQGLVAHGSGSETGIEGKLKFSNINNSLSTSLGKYFVGKSYNGQFGKAYKLYGLDSTNSNAYNRNIVLHKYSKVPYDEQDMPICNSFGCPMVNEKYYQRIESILDNSKKNIILDIYY